MLVGVAVGVLVAVSVGVSVAVRVGVRVSVGVVVGVDVGVLVGVVTARHCENSEVLPKMSAAVAVMNKPVSDAGTISEKLVLPLPSVGFSWSGGLPRKVRPWPLPLLSQTLLEKSSKRNWLLTVLLSVP